MQSHLTYNLEVMNVVKKVKESYLKIVKCEFEQFKGESKILIFFFPYTMEIYI